MGAGGAGGLEAKEEKIIHAVRNGGPTPGSQSLGACLQLWGKLPGHLPRQESGPPRGSAQRPSILRSDSWWATTFPPSPVVGGATKSRPSAHSLWVASTERTTPPLAGRWARGRLRPSGLCPHQGSRRPSARRMVVRRAGRGV